MANTNSKKEWHEFYTQPITLPEFVRVIHSHKAYLSALVNLINPNEKILEIGCGTSIDSIYLSHFGYKLTALDNNPKVLELAKRNNDYFRGSVEYVLGDMFDLRFQDKEFKACFSQGAINYSPPEKIQQSLIQQAKIADFVLFSVPSIHFEGSQSFGGSRLWSFNQWLGIIKNFKIIDYGGYGYNRLGRTAEKIDKVILKNNFKKITSQFFAPNIYFIISSK